jgi:anthranilate phosphoribosyltransferase
MMLGVYSPELAPIYAQALFNLGVEHALVVNAGGLDELAPVGNIVVFEVKKSGVTELKLDTDAEGVPACAISDLKGMHACGLDPRSASVKGPSLFRFAT